MCCAVAARPSPIGGRARTRSQLLLTVADANVTINERDTRPLQFCEVPKKAIGRAISAPPECRRRWYLCLRLRPDLSTNGALTIPRYRVEPRRCPSPVCLLHSTTQAGVLESRRLGKSPSAGAWADKDVLRSSRDT